MILGKFSFSPSSSSFRFFVAMSTTCRKSEEEKKNKRNVVAYQKGGFCQEFYWWKLSTLNAWCCHQRCPGFTYFFLPLRSCPGASHFKWSIPLLPSKTVVSHFPYCYMFSGLVGENKLRNCIEWDGKKAVKEHNVSNFNTTSSVTIGQYKMPLFLPNKVWSKLTVCFLCY